MSAQSVEPEDCFEIWEAAENAVWLAAVQFAHEYNAEAGQEVIDASTVYVTFDPGAANRHVGCGCSQSVAA